jgi:hypothetical protein
MSEKLTTQPKFFFKVEPTGRINSLQDESIRAFNLKQTAKMPVTRQENTI